MKNILLKNFIQIDKQAEDQTAFQHLQSSKRGRVAFKIVRQTSMWRRLHVMTWICLLFACVAASWFAGQYYLVPQTKSFSPDWQGARWIQADGDAAPVAYFRSTLHLNALPDSAFVTIAASQVFRLYVNGTFIGSNQLDFVRGNFPKAFMYDVTSSLHSGVNTIAVRVANIDERNPSLIASFGMAHGHSLLFEGTASKDSNWQATTQTTQVYLRNALNKNAWTTPTFDASSWLSARATTPTITSSTSPMLNVNPAVYEQPISTQWMSAAATHDAYFVQQLPLSFGVTDVWLRLIATGTANVYINGKLFIAWNSQPTLPSENLENYLSSDPAPVKYRSGLALGIYDVSPYLHPGINTIAIHVLSPGVSAAQVGLDSLSSAMSFDMLVHDWQNHDTWFTSASAWHGSPRPVNGWAQGSATALAWPSPVIVGRPGANHSFYLQDSSNIRSVQVIPATLLAEVILGSTITVLGVWLLMALWVLRRVYPSRRDALETAGLAFLPAIAFEILLIVLAREPQIPRPFPYTLFWGVVLVGIVALSNLVLWRNARNVQRESALGFSKESSRLMAAILPVRSGLIKGYQRYRLSTSSLTVDRQWAELHWRTQILGWIRTHWILILLLLIAVPLIGYNLGYEPYWQDELASYYPAVGILSHGLPIFPSGFIYTKAELYSYCLALWMAIFGANDGLPRMLSAIEYLASIPLLYFIGSYFFERRIALLATAMLVFSPISLIWGAQMRMYEQEQLMTILVLYLFYRAFHDQHNTKWIYLAVASLLIDYFSHEEIFIIFPALLMYGLVATREAKRPLPRVFYQKHWWFACLLGAGVILLQLLSVHFTHVATLGTDQSQEPLVQFTTNNITYYVDLMFFPNVLGAGTEPWIVLNSLLAAGGCVWARHSTNRRVKYCAVFLVISFITLTFAFTLSSDRYIYPLLPVFYLLGAYAFAVVLRTLRVFATTRLVLTHPRYDMTIATKSTSAYTLRVVLFFTRGTATLLCIALLIAPILPISSYNRFISQMAGFSYHRHYPDYDAAGQYMHAHWRQGDIVISVAPAISVLYYVGHVDYFFSVNRALYLFERDGQITDTPTGSTPLLSQADFQSVLSAHARIWIISDNGEYQAAINKVFTFPSDFHMVFEGYGSAVYFRGGSG